MPPRTVLYLTPSSRLLGARRSLLQLVTNLDRERWRPVVVAQGPGDLVDALRDAGVTVHLLFMGWWRKGMYWPLIPIKVAQLARLARRERADLMHCNEFHPNPYAVLASRRAGQIPVVTHMRLSITPRQIRNYLLRRAARVIVVSNAAARHFHVWPDWRDRVDVVYNGVDLQEFQPRADAREARRRLGLREEDFVVGQFGLFSPRKRQHLLLKAAAQLKDGVPGLRILIVGSAGRTELDYEYELKTTAAALGLGEIVRFVSFTPHVAELYQACDVNILISTDEGFGRTIIEAGALAVPSIGARTGGIPEIINEGETGYLIPADDDGTALADRIRDLALDRARCRALGLAARDRVAAHFSITTHVEQITRIYEQVLTRGA
jgi:glycosyltransferase involved in cell wall biosynthesis